jgi:hypothetical protein
MLNTMREQAVQRIQEILKHQAYEGPADIIADLVHYLGDDFESELIRAHEYVSEELGYDEEMVE